MDSDRLDRKEIYKQAIEKWGNALQIIMVFEEMSEKKSTNKQ